VDISIDKLGPLSAGNGDQITYVLTITNSGGDPADQVTVTDTLPAGLSFVGEDSPPEVMFQDSTPPDIVWTVDTVAAGASFQIDLVVQVGQAVKGEVVNQAQVTTTTPGDDPDDNVASAVTIVLPPHVINEILADPAIGAAGDANGDGVFNPAQDEFVEIVNNTGGDLDLGGWSLSDSVEVRHVFPEDTRVPERCVVVVFGGGALAGDFDSAVVQIASTGGLALDNSGDTVILRDAGGQVVASYAYGPEAGMDQSITREPDLVGPPALVPHGQAEGSNGALFSPGRRLSGAIFGGCLAVDINEIRIDQPSGATDPDEYFELRGASGTDLSGLTYVVLGGNGSSANSGVVERIISLDRQEMESDGLFLVVESTFTLLPLFFADMVIPGGENIFREDNNATHLLVANFSGAVGLDVDVNNNGTFDFAEGGSSLEAPWTDVLDAVGLVEDAGNPPAGTGFAYGAALGFVNVGPDGGSVPAHVYRCVPDDLWLIGTLDKFDPDGADTPGTVNEDNCPTGACCLGSGDCLDALGQTDCAAQGGAWQGVDSTCADVTCPTACPPDVTGDGLVDVGDLVAVIVAWGTSDPDADIDGSGLVDVSDLVAVLVAWGVCR
jgi:uncharacterized repeat protein (TIGR01451 family)